MHINFFDSTTQLITSYGVDKTKSAFDFSSIKAAASSIKNVPFFGTLKNNFSDYVAEIKDSGADISLKIADVKNRIQGTGKFEAVSEQFIDGFVVNQLLKNYSNNNNILASYVLVDSIGSLSDMYKSSSADVKAKVDSKLSVAFKKEGYVSSIATLAMYAGALGLLYMLYTSAIDIIGDAGDITVNSSVIVIGFFSLVFVISFVLSLLGIKL